MNLRLLAGASKPGLDPAAELLLALPKSNQKASPCTPPISSSARVARAENKSPESCADAQPVGSHRAAWTACHCAPRGESTGTRSNRCLIASRWVARTRWRGTTLRLLLALHIAAHLRKSFCSSGRRQKAQRWSPECVNVNEPQPPGKSDFTQAVAAHFSRFIQYVLLHFLVAIYEWRPLELNVSAVIWHLANQKTEGLCCSVLLL